MWKRRSDAELKQRIERELSWDSRLSHASIDVDVKDGVATLTGIVSNYALKIAAQEAAHRVAGVFDVANEIAVKAVDRYARQDKEIANAVRAALEWDALVPNEKITSTVSYGWVTLEGIVNYWREREDAEKAIRRLNGVVGVINKIAVQGRYVNPEELREQIEHALERRVEREAERLKIEVSDGAVDLRGRVHSWQEKRAILGSISHAPGVTKLVDHLRVDPYF